MWSRLRFYFFPQPHEHRSPMKRGGGPNSRAVRSSAVMCRPKMLDLVDVFAVVERDLHKGIVIDGVFDHVDRHRPAVDHVARLTIFGGAAPVGVEVAHE